MGAFVKHKNPLLLSKGFFLTLTLLIFLSTITHSQNQKRKEIYNDCIQGIELSDINPLSFQNLDIKSCSIFGVYLGMDLNQVRKVIAENTSINLILEVDRYNNDRFYISENLNDSLLTRKIVYLNFIPNQLVLNEITILQSANECFEFSKQWKTIFSCEGLDSTSHFSKSWSGNFNLREEELNIPAQSLFSNYYYFPAKNYWLYISSNKGRVNNSIILK